MKLVVGLGNPGNQYNFTRHNTGFLALDFYFKLYKLTWHDKPRLGAIMGRSEGIIFIKPQDFYNNSGQAVKSYLRHYRLSISDLLVVCDDFNLPFGQIKYRSQGSAGGNNGLKSIITELNTTEFARIRIGTGNDELRHKIGDTDFVLSKFTTEEKSHLSAILIEVSDRLNKWQNPS